MIVHAGLVATRIRGRWSGVLIQGPSGNGKSDLALRLLERGFRLVADDRVELIVSRSRLFGYAPKALADLLEVRGFGLASIVSLAVAEIAFNVSCVESGAVERLPAVARTSILGLEIPTTSIAALEASAPAKLCRAIEALGTGQQQDYDPAFPRTARRGST